MALVTLTVTLLLLVTVGVVTEKVSFIGYELVSVFARNRAEVNILWKLCEKHPQLDFWEGPGPEMNSTVLVPPQFLQEFKDAVRSQEMSLAVLSDDVQSIVDAGSKRTPEAVVQARSRASGHVIDHYNYHTYTKIQHFLTKLAARYPRSVHVSHLPYSTHEGRSVAVVKLTGSAGTNKPVIIVEAGIHAREWISPAAIMWSMEKVLRDYRAGVPSARLMLNKYDWYLVPVTNPDGYEHTHSTDRNWRKNKRFTRKDCYGVDLNRNFDIEFGTTGVRHECNSFMYPGTSAFSEPETANIRDLFNSLSRNVAAYVAVHSYSQMVLVPWSYTGHVSRPDNHVELDRVTKKMTTAISQRHGKTYRHGTPTELLGPASGTSVDWAMDQKSNLYSLAFELRPRTWEEGGFFLPASEIVPTGEELYASLAVLAKEMRT